MTDRLHAELQRLFLPSPAADAGADAGTALIDRHGTRAMALELARPADWDQLSKVWRGVQTDLELPAPAFAVTGSDGFALWFSLVEPVAVAQAQAFLQSLCAAQLLPPKQQPTGYWSAFVAADLAPIFADTPWLDSAPGNDGQAGVLSTLASITPSAFDAALERLDARVIAAPPSAIDIPPALPAAATTHLAPRQFLLQIMNDDSVALALRIEAARALLPYFELGTNPQDRSP